MTSDPISMAVIGGSGLYELAGLRDTVEYFSETPFGKPSAPVLVGSVGGRRVAFLARHGVGHRLAPTEVPYAANIYTLKTLGVDRVVSISACGSLREDLAPGQIAIPDQLYDHTTGRVRSFFGEGLVGHVSMPDPFCPDLSHQLADAVTEAGGEVHQGGTFITVEGPRFSTRAESNLFRAWGMSLIGMTTSPEAFLAREAEMCYAVMAHITDYDVWHLNFEPVTVETVMQILEQNTRLAQEAIRRLVAGLRSTRSCDCGTALQNALITRRDAIPESTLRKLEPLIRKYLAV